MKLIACFAVFILGVFALSESLRTDSAGEVMLVCDKGNIIDLGERLEGVLTGSIDITNKSNHDVSIVSIKKACSCIEVEFPKVLKARSTRRLFFEWNVTGFDGDASLPFVLFFRSGNTGELQEFQVAVKVFVYPEFRLSQSALIFDVTNKPSEIQKRELDVVPGTKKDISLLKAETVSSDLNVSVTNKTLVVEYLPEDGSRSPGSLTYVFLYTNSEKRKKLTIPIGFR